ncbi:cytochrome c [Acuticoccus sp. MNP-M23]|uniref:c-type cytochrome n=1 Tax=Acuticoccus sp. MNP-M23 TaxID=3072793 RepID=UPI002814CD42|nr:cytochrome c [Acuticoccus sp. MNP-M23]WMS43482.1 cytochrome c [Acuticoccus sp. MNP-M23]
MRPLLLAGAGVAIGLAAVAAFGLWPPKIDPPKRLLPGDAQVVALGQTIYETRCASCHGPNLEGQPNWREQGPDGRLPAPPHDETGHTWHHPDALLFKLTKYGLPKEMGNGEPYFSNMPAYEGMLTDEDIIAVLSYIKSRWPQEIRQRHDTLNAQMAAQ